MPKPKIYAVAAAYCGAVVGAGFATGREVVTFFSSFGSEGIIGVILATMLFMWAGVVILDVTHQNSVYSYLDLLRCVLGHKALVVVADLLFLGTLLSGIGVMTAAGGTVLSGWGVWYPAGCALFIGVCIVLLLRGSSGFVQANTWLVPGMTLIIIILCVAQISIPTSGIVPTNPYGSALLYVAYNTAIAAVALATLKDHLSRKVVLWGGLGGGLLIGSLLMLVFLATMGLPGIAVIPMRELAEIWFGRWPWLYDLVLLGAVLTTALANLHGLASRVAAKGRYLSVLILISAMGLVISQYGFASLVGLLYPLLGLCNVVLLAGMCYYSCIKLKFLIRNR